MRRLTARAWATCGLTAALLATGRPVAAAGGPPLLAGAAGVEMAVPPGSPLGGYGGFPRRAWLPHVLPGSPHAFWFNPAEGVHDAPRARALVIEAGETRLLWLAADLVGVDPTLLDELRERLARRGQRYSALIVSASHTHSGPGAFARSSLFGLVALDRLSPDVRAGVLDALESAAGQAQARRAPARVGTARTEVSAVAKSRLDAPLDPELGVLKVVGEDGRPIAMIWNYAIHGTALGRGNLLLSGDLMADASARIEGRLGAPALYVNGAVADVSPARHGWEGVREAGATLSRAALAAWEAAVPEPRARLATLADRVRLPHPRLSVRNCVGRWVPRWVRLGLGRALPTSGELVAVAVGDSAWVTVPGELQTQLGEEVKAAGRRGFPRAFVAGVSNDYLGYFLTPEAYDRPSYIACGSLYGATGGILMRDAATGLLDRLGRGEAGGRTRR